MRYTCSAFQQNHCFTDLRYPTEDELPDGVFRCINRPWACHQSSCNMVVLVRVWVRFRSGLGLRSATGARRRVSSVGTADSGTVEARCQPELCRSLTGKRVLKGNGMETLIDKTCTWSLSYFYSVDARLGLTCEEEGSGALRNVYRAKPHRPSRPRGLRHSFIYVRLLKRASFADYPA